MKPKAAQIRHRASVAFPSAESEAPQHSPELITDISMLQSTRSVSELGVSGAESLSRRNLASSPSVRTRLFDRSLTLSLTHSLARSLAPSLAPSLTHSLARSLTRSLFTHPLHTDKHTDKHTEGPANPLFHPLRCSLPPASSLRVTLPNPLSPM